MQIPFYVVNAFVDGERSFSGNPAAVVLLASDGDISEEDKQKVASQFNLSETVFVSKLAAPQASEAQFLIRWLTPTTEVSLCGHATLAATHILLKERHLFSAQVEKGKSVKFATKYGTYIQCAKNNENLVLNFPLNEPLKLDADSYKWIKQFEKVLLGQCSASLVDVQWSEGTNKLLLVVHSAEAEQVLTQIKPDFTRMLQINTDQMVRGLIVSQKANMKRDKVHFWSRYFSPWNGINEDPVTGSSFTVLVPYWKKIYQNEGQNIDLFYAKQLSQRGGLVQSKIVENRVHIGGKAEIFCQGTFQV